jgi:RNA polymerase sigma-70 factor, ECF subfamily
MASAGRANTAVVEAKLDKLLDAGAYDDAATTVIREYGPELLGYLSAIMRNEDWGRDVFAQFCENMWRGLRAFRRESSVRTWCYVLAWNAGRRFDRDEYRRRVRRLETTEAWKLAQQVTSISERADRSVAAQLRESLEPFERTLLILRVDRGLSWDEVTQVMSDPDEPVTKDALKKRFERIKTRLRELAHQRGSKPA